MLLWLLFCGCDDVRERAEHRNRLRNAAYMAMGNEIVKVEIFRSSGDYVSAQKILRELHAWANTIADKEKREAYVYTLDIEDDILNDSIAEQKLMMPVPPPMEGK